MKYIFAVFFYSLAFLSSTNLLAQKSQWYFRKGERSFDSKNWTEAKAAFETSGASFASQYNAASAMYEDGKNEEAISLLENALKNAESKAEKSNAFYNLGNALLRLGKYQKAIEAYENSLLNTSNSQDAQKNLQIAKKKLQTPPPKPPPPIPPPPIAAPQQRYLDQAPASPSREKPTDPISEDQARKILETTIVPDEQRNVRAYRELAPAVRATRAKDW
jgi:tetratricopeptide (TPR) repeat protein